MTEDFTLIFREEQTSVAQVTWPNSHYYCSLCQNQPSLCLIRLEPYLNKYHRYIKNTLWIIRYDWFIYREFKLYISCVFLLEGILLLFNHWIIPNPYAVIFWRIVMLLFYKLDNSLLVSVSICQASKKDSFAINSLKWTIKMFYLS